MAANRHVSFPVEVTLPDTLALTSDLAEAVRDAAVVILVVTAKGTRPTAKALAQSGALPPQAVVMNASKGIDFPSLQPLSSAMAEELPPGQPQAVLSGPTLAKEILAGLPTACSLAAQDLDTAQRLQQLLSVEKCFRLYAHTDMLGAELGGALKNIFAIASGYMQAKHLGENARAALITRGLAEMTRFCVRLGADEPTLYGLSGLGDLLATCNSPLSRNYQVGYQLAQGKTVTQILDDLKVVAEGVDAARAVAALAQAKAIDTPIVQQVALALAGETSMDALVGSLMSRKLKTEHAG